MSTKDGGCTDLSGLIPRVLQALHANKVWESVKSAEDIRCGNFDYSNHKIGILTPVNTEESPVVVKFESSGNTFKIEPQTVEIHQLLSDQGLSTKLLAFSLRDDENSNLPNFTVEAVGVCYFDMVAAFGSAADPNYWLTANSATETGGVMAKLAAKLHKKVPVFWFDKYRSKIIKLCPLMKDEALDSPLWVMMRTDALGQARLAAKLNAEQLSAGDQGDEVEVQVTTCTQKFLNQKRSHSPSNEDMKRIAALLPKPFGQHASRLVTIHGDLWAANVVKDTRSNEAVLIDLEGVTVSYAATELAQFCPERGVSQVYLEELLEGKDMPTAEDIDKFWFEVLIAGHIQTSILRPMCWEDATLEIDSVNKKIAYAERFLTYVEKLRSDWDLTLQILSKAADIYAKGGDMEQWCSEEVMDSVLGNGSMSKEQPPPSGRWDGDEELQSEEQWDDDHPLPQMWEPGTESLAPWVGTPSEWIVPILQNANITVDDVLCDVGCGDGRIPIIARQHFKVRLAMGIDIDEGLIETAKIHSKRRIGEDKEGIRFIHGDALKEDLSMVTLMVVYLLEDSFKILAPLFETHLSKPGTRLVVLGWKLPDLVPYDILEVGADETATSSNVYFYNRTSLDDTASKQ